MRYLVLFVLFVSCKVQPSANNADESKLIGVEPYRTHLNCLAEDGELTLRVELLYETNNLEAIEHDDMTCAAFTGEHQDAIDISDIGMCGFEAFQSTFVITHIKDQVLVKKYDVHSDEISFTMYCEELEE